MEILQGAGLEPADADRIEGHGLELAQVATIVQKLQAEPRYLPLLRAATSADGVQQLPDQEALAARFDRLETKPAKLTPMSGVASRMFGFLERFLVGEPREGDADKLEQFIAGLDPSSHGPRFAFRAELAAKLARDGLDLGKLIERGEHRAIVEYTLAERGLGFRGKPKALIPFHERDGRGVTALEEHMKEALGWAGGRLYITISAEHEGLFSEAIAAIRQQSSALGRVKVRRSVQHPSTDSVALDGDSGQLVRDERGRIAFFPAGHGSLLANIGELDGPVVLRNVDNTPKSAAAQGRLERYHKAAAVLLAEIKAAIAEALYGLDEPTLGQAELEGHLERLRAYGLQLHLDSGAYRQASFEQKKALVRRALDRPVKIVGVVPNEGDAGGGPFIIDYGGAEIVSIVEKAEISAEQKHLMRDGEFFNPVDVLADPTDVRGGPMSLRAFVNHHRHFLVRKPWGGREVVRYEHPGLWNGAMDGWTALFVALPIDIFAPVKEVVDLLRPAHQDE